MSKKGPKRNIKYIIKKNKILANLCVLLIGVIFLGLGATNIIPSADAKNIILNIGCSILASSLVVLFTLLLLEDDERDSKLLELYDKWGIVNFFETRSEQNVATAAGFPDLKIQYDQIAFGLKSLRDAKGKKFEDKVRNGLRIRILTMNPNSLYLKERERVEGKQEGEIRQTIFQLEQWINNLKAISPNPDNVQIKYYDSLPLIYYCRQEDDLFVGPYLYGKESQQTITYQFNNIGLGFRYYSEYFELLWNDESFAKPSYDIIDSSSSSEVVVAHP